MAATITKLPNGEDAWGKTKVQAVDVTGDNSYPTGGYVIAPARVGMKTILGAKVIGVGLFYEHVWVQGVYHWGQIYIEKIPVASYLR